MLVKQGMKMERSAIICLNTSIIRGIEWEPKSFIDSENLDIHSENLDIHSENLDIHLENVDIHSENFDISLETNDIDIQKIITCIQSTMISKKN